MSGRTRLEQRFPVGSDDDVAWRVRQRLRLETPLIERTKVKAAFWNETFIDQVHSFIGIGLPPGKGLTLDRALYQIVFHRGPERVNHIAALNLLARL